MPADDQSSIRRESFDLRTYLDILGRRWRIILAVALTAVVLAVGLSLQQEKQYKVSADLLLSRIPNAAAAGSSIDAYVAAVSAGRLLTNDVEALESRSTRDAVAGVYDGPLDPDDVSISFAPTASDLVTLSLTAPDSVEAAELVNTYVDVFIERFRSERIDELAAMGAQIEKQLDEIAEQIATIRQPLTSVEQQLQERPGDPTLINRRDDLALTLESQLDPLETQRAGYQATLESVRFNTGIQATEGPKLISQAEPSSDPVSPKPVQNGVLAFVVGLLLGTVLAFLRDSLDERLRGMSDLEHAAPGIPVFAVVPQVRGNQPESYVAMRDEPRSMAAEAFRTLRTSVKFAGLDSPLRVVQVTSPLPGEGKTTAIANLAEAFAQGGERVAVICCDLRKPKIHRRFEQPLAPGFTDVLLGEATLAEAMKQVHPYLFLLPAGPPPPNPSELLSSSRALAVVNAVADEFDIVLIDCTPILPVTDALVISRLVDATLLVVDARTTKKGILHQAYQRLSQVNAPVKGIVLNGAGAGDGYQYGYVYAYGSESGDESSKKSERVPASARR